MELQNVHCMHRRAEKKQMNCFIDLEIDIEIESTSKLNASPPHKSTQHITLNMVRLSEPFLDNATIIMQVGRQLLCCSNWQKIWTSSQPQKHYIESKHFGEIT